MLLCSGESEMAVVFGDSMWDGCLLEHAHTNSVILLVLATCMLLSIHVHSS